MPSDSNGVYSLPAGYLATLGDEIEPSQHNAPLEDIESGLTARLMRSGVAPMTGPLLLADGTLGAPALALASVPGAGFYKSGSSLAPVGVIGTMPVGAMLDYAGLSAPTGWLSCAGQSLLRADYAALFTAIGTSFGAADGTHFSLPDTRCVVTAGKGDMVSGDRGLLTGSTVMGALLGTQTVTLGTANLPAYTPAGTVGSTLENGGTSQFATSVIAPPGGGTPITVMTVNAAGGATLTVTADIDSDFTGAAQGGVATPVSTVQPTLIVHKIIFAGV